MRLTMKEKMQKSAVNFLLKLPLSLQKKLAGKPIEIDGYTMDPVVQMMLRFMGDPPNTVTPREIERRNFDVQGNWATHTPHPDVTISELIVNGTHGPIPCEVHRPKNLPRDEAPALIFHHGGGHVSGSLTSHRDVCRQLAYEVNCAVIAVDYRLSPEHKFPIGIQDCLDVYDYVSSNAEEMGLNPDRISVGGDSAGGNCSAVVAQQRRSAKHPPKFQMLWVPWVDMSKQAPSYHTVGVSFFLEKVAMEAYTNHYLNNEEDALNPLASPLLGDVSGVCPAGVLIAGFDPLRDEGIAYAEKLKAAGVKTIDKVYGGVVHPFINVAGKVPVARSAFNDAVKILRENM